MMPAIVNYILQGVVFILSVIGMILLGRKNRLSFILFLGANILGPVIALNVRPIVFSAVAMSLILIVLNTINYRKWGK